jgi:Flp pilus assembly protein TadG
MKAVYALVRSFSTDRHAVSAVEFALILPLMLLMLLGSFDVTRAVDAKNKSVLLSRTVADFVSQQRDGVTKVELGNIIFASKYVMSPYPVTTDDLNIKVESINRLGNGTYEADWSFSYGPGASPVFKSTNEAATPVPDTSSIRASVKYTYSLKFAKYLTEHLGFAQVELNSTTHMSPRWAAPVTASGW